MNTPLVSIIVLHWRYIERTKICIEHLRLLDYPSYQVVLVDNGSHNGSFEELQQIFPEIQTLALTENRGFAGGVNPAIYQALQQGADYVVLLNNDTLVPKDFLTQLVTVHQQHPLIGVLSPRVVHDQQPDILAGLGCRIQKYTIELIGWDTHMHEYEKHLPILLDAVFGCAMLIPCNIFEKVGLFDERFFFYYEDVDFCQRVRACGYQVGYLADVIVRHAVGSSTRHIRGLRDFYLARSRQIFFRKHRHGIIWIGYLIHETLDALRVIGRKLTLGEYAQALGYTTGVMVGLVLAYLEFNR